MTVRLARGLLSRAAREPCLLCLVLLAPPGAALSWLSAAGHVLERTPLTARGLPDEPETPGMVHVLPHPDGGLLMADVGDFGRAARRRAVEVVVAALDEAGADGELAVAPAMQGPGPVLSPACGAYLVLSADADPATVVGRLLPWALPSGRGIARFVATEVPVDRDAVLRCVGALPFPGTMSAYDTDGKGYWSSMSTGWTVSRQSRMTLHLGLGGPPARQASAWEGMRDAMVAVAGDLAYGCVYSAPDTDWLIRSLTFALPQFLDDEEDLYHFYQEPDRRVPGVFWAQVLGPEHRGTVSGQALDRGRRLVQLGSPAGWAGQTATWRDRHRLGLT